MATIPNAMTSDPEPAWDIAKLFPPQGQWSEKEYLELTASTNCLVEFTDGRIEVLDMPTTSHPLILLYLIDLLRDFVRPRSLGIAICAPVRMRVGPGKFREPDILFMLAENKGRVGEDYWEGADLVLEVVSTDSKSRRRDLEEKRVDYAEARIPEYWIVDPESRRITVLALAGGASRYSVHGDFPTGQQATSQLLGGFAVEVESVFAAAKP